MAGQKTNVFTNARSWIKRRVPAVAPLLNKGITERAITERGDDDLSDLKFERAVIDGDDGAVRNALAAVLDPAAIDHDIAWDAVDSRSRRPHPQHVG